MSSNSNSIYAESSNLNFRDLVFTQDRNTIPSKVIEQDGGIIYGMDNTGVDISNSVFEGKHTYSRGGALYLTHTVATEDTGRPTYYISQ